VVEIGGGFGGLARTICRALAVQHYTLIDNIAVLRIQRRFLEMADIETPPAEGFTFHTQEDFIAGVLSDAQVDVVVNTRSMMEMELSEINRYFHWIAGALCDPGFFYSVNRLTKETRLVDWPWSLFDVERRAWPTYIDHGPMVESFAKRRLQSEHPTNNPTQDRDDKGHMSSL
jgi:hypothetical protein